MYPETRRAIEPYGIERRQSRAARRARRLGWLSIGLGVAELLGPSRVARFVGIRDTERTRHILQTLGLREISSGVAILTSPDSVGPVWTRVVGDVMDLGLLGLALGSEDAERDRVLAATAAVAGITAIDALSAAQLGRANGETGGGNGSSALRRRGTDEGLEPSIRLARAITIKRPRDEVYAFWKNFENLPRFLQHVESIRTEGARSRWRARLFGGNPLEWDAEIILDRPNESIEWRSFEGGDISSRGAVRFLDAPAGRGTEVKVEIEYEPSGLLGAAFGKLFGRMPALQIANDLKRLKQLLEVGEVVHSDASIHRGMHPARPSPAAQPSEKAVTS